MGLPMTPRPIKPICMIVFLSFPKVYILCLLSVLHFDYGRTPSDYSTFLVIDMLYLSVVRCCNRVFHLHGAENDQNLVGLNYITIVHLYFDDGTGHGSDERLLSIR